MEERKLIFGLNEEGMGWPHLPAKSWRRLGRCVAAEMRHEEKGPEQNRLRGGAADSQERSPVRSGWVSSIEGALGAVNVWMSGGSWVAASQRCRGRRGEDRAGVKRANWESNCEDGGSWHCCPSWMFQKATSALRYHYSGKLSVFVFFLPGVLSQSLKGWGNILFRLVLLWCLEYHYWLAQSSSCCRLLMRVQIHHRPWFSLTFTQCTLWSAAAAHYTRRLLHWCNFIWRFILLNVRPPLLSLWEKQKRKAECTNICSFRAGQKASLKPYPSFKVKWQPGGKNYIRFKKKRKKRCVPFITCLFQTLNIRTKEQQKVRLYIRSDH